MLGGRGPRTGFDQMDTILGKGTELQGTITASGTVRIDGHLSGDVQVDGDMIISESGTVKADIRARHLIVAGEVDGNIELTGRLEIASTGKIRGDIRVVSLSVAEGGYLAGNCTMLDLKSGQ